MAGKRETAALAKARKIAPVPDQAIEAYAVVIAPSAGDGITGARLYRFKVSLADGEMVGNEDAQDIVIARAIDAIEDQIVGR